MKLSFSSLRKAAEIEQRIEQLEAELESVLRSSKGAHAGRHSKEIIVEDPDVQGGVPTFKGTRIPVYQIAGLLKQGVGRRGITGRLSTSYRRDDRRRPDLHSGVSAWKRATQAELAEDQAVDEQIDQEAP